MGNTPTMRAVDGSWVCMPNPHGGGYITAINGMTLQTRFPWAAFDNEWRGGLREYARQAYESPPPGWEVEFVRFDHLNLERKTFEPFLQLRRVRT